MKHLRVRIADPWPGLQLVTTECQSVMLFHPVMVFYLRVYFFGYVTIYVCFTKADIRILALIINSVKLLHTEKVSTLDIAKAGIVIV
jgi:hypothetical protein